jgi:hypothetical protein
MEIDSKQYTFGVLSALALSVLVSETWFIIRNEIDIYTVECMVFKMRYSPTFNKYNLNSVLLFFTISLSWHTMIQKGHGEALKVQSKFKER